MTTLNLIRNLTTLQASRYIELCEKLNVDGFKHDLSDPCDRAIVDVTLSRAETLELLSLHDTLHAPDLADFEDTQRVSTQGFEAVS